MGYAIMALRFMYITNDEQIAKIAEACGIDWIFIDLEINGKEQRQGHLDTVISRHRIGDVRRIKTVLTKSKLLVRVNPIHDGSEAEINKVIHYGADIVMLPFFKDEFEVETFIRYVDKKAKICLLVETPEAVENIDNILALTGIDYIHIGLNDLHLGYGMSFMFELLADGTVDMLCKKISEKGIPYGFGGVARLGKGDLPAEYVIAEHYRLGSSMAILARSFCNPEQVNSIEEIEILFSKGLQEIREYERQLKNKDDKFFNRNHRVAKEKILAIKTRKELS